MNELEKNQELLNKAMRLREQSEEIERQLDFISEQISDLQNFHSSLELLKQENEKEMLAHIGRRTYLKVSLLEKDKLFVEVGSGIVVRKTLEEAIKDVEKQLKKFQEAKAHLALQLKGYADEFRKLLQEVENIKSYS